MNLTVMRLLLTAAMTAMALSFTTLSCNNETADPLSQAESDYEMGLYSSAQSVCDGLIASDEFERLSVNELCRLSVLMVKLADHSDESSNMAYASRCMQAALKMQSDSVIEYVRTLPVDEQSLTILLQQLSRSLDRDSVEPIREYDALADSIPLSADQTDNP